MADRPATDLQRHAAADSVVRLVRKRHELVDEVYLQILRQLIDNPSSRSLALGWELLSTLSKSTSPSDQLFEYVRAFLVSAQSRPDAVAAKSAENCSASLKELDALPRVQGYLQKSKR